LEGAVARKYFTAELGNARIDGNYIDRLVRELPLRQEEVCLAVPVTAEKSLVSELRGWTCRWRSDKESADWSKKT